MILSEEPSVENGTEVIVTFLPDGDVTDVKQKKIVLGLLEGKIDTPEDFNEPLEDLKDYM